VDWSSEDVVRWLSDIDLSAYSEIFAQNHINGQALLDLAPKEIQEDLHISSLGHRKLLLKKIEQLKESEQKRLAFADSATEPPSREELSSIYPSPLDFDMNKLRDAMDEASKALLEAKPPAEDSDSFWLLPLKSDELNALTNGTLQTACIVLQDACGNYVTSKSTELSHTFREGNR